MLDYNRDARYSKLEAHSYDKTPPEQIVCVLSTIRLTSVHRDTKYGIERLETGLYAVEYMIQYPRILQATVA